MTALNASGKSCSQAGGLALCRYFRHFGGKRVQLRHWTATLALDEFVRNAYYWNSISSCEGVQWLNQPMKS